ncbi:MAG: phosphoribosylanthranilate isomerase [Acidobacteria bacterium]|nr:phosphoribosylanthranilate isomerase [Acidobacteriota bacterium]
MSRTRIKICGLTSIDDAQLAVDLGADAVGFVFWPASKRYITPERAGVIVATLPRFVTAVGVFVNQPPDQIRRVVEEVGLGAVQLHGDEPAEEWTTMPCQTIKAVGVDAAFDAASLTAWPSTVMPLLDVFDPERRGGTGQSIDWTRAAAAANKRRVVLAGGLRPDNVERAIDIVAPYAVDVSSGVERQPGVKDADRLRAFFAAVARAAGGRTR